MPKIIMLLIEKSKKCICIMKLKVYYTDMEITAGTIVIDYSKNLIYAGRIKDTAGVYSQRPVFKQGDNLIEPDSIIFNFKNKKAIIFNSNTEQEGMKIMSESSKKENDSVYFLNKMRITTAER